MSDLDDDLRGFLDVVAKVTSSSADEAASTDPLAPLAEAGLLDLARDMAGEPEALVWQSHVVRVASRQSPSIGFALAARYTADRALDGVDAGEQATGTFALASGARAVAATVLRPDVVVALDVDTSAVRRFELGGPDGAEPSGRTGLYGAELVTVPVPDAAEEVDVDGTTVLADWDVLTGAVLVGIAGRALDTTRTYVLERRQFGAPIGSFAGLRAIVAEMALRVDGLEALLEQRSGPGAASESISAVAGRAAVDTCVDAIQAHGGYGYIEEYPLAGLLRDAISVQARSGGRRLHVARVAERALGTPDRVRA